MPAWLSDAVILASARNRSTNSGSLVSSERRIFTATWRASLVSSAAHTSPIPPTAIRRVNRYRSDSRSPGVSAIAHPDQRVRRAAGRASRAALDSGGDDLVPDRRRDGCAGGGQPLVATVLHQHRHRDLRIV